MVTFPREVEVIWKAKFKIPTFLYYIIRYLPLVETWLTLFTNAISAGATDSSCTGLVRLLQAISVVALVVFSVFTALRIYAIWSRNYFLFVALFLLGCFEPAANILFSAHDNQILSAPKPLNTCISFLDQKASQQVYNTIPLATSGVKVGYEMLVFVLTVLKTFTIWRESRVLGKNLSFSGLILRDGSIYFFVIAAVSILDIILREISSSSAFLGIASIYTPVLTPILYSRFILDLRRGQKHQGNVGGISELSTQEVSTVQFHRARAPKLNLGQDSEWGGYLESTLDEESSSEMGEMEGSDEYKGTKNTGGEGIRMVNMSFPGSERTERVD